MARITTKNYTQEYQNTQDVINRFSQACNLGRDHGYGWAYEAGWLQSAYARVLMSLPRNVRDQELKVLHNKANQIEAEQVVRQLISRE